MGQGTGDTQFKRAPISERWTEWVEIHAFGWTGANVFLSFLPEIRNERVQVNIIYEASSHTSISVI